MIIVTGSYGRVGRAVCEELAARSLEWQGVDIVARPQFTPSGRFSHRQADLTSFGETIDMLKGASAVIHAAAVAYPYFCADHETFAANTQMSFNILSAANTLGIRKVVWLSSEKVYGYPFGVRKPHYFPIDEKHPVQAESIYGLSKCVGEMVARELGVGRDASFISLRSTLVQSVENYPEYPSFEADPAIRKWALWSYIDARDLARACRLAVQADLPGVHAYSIAAPDTVMNVPSADLAARYFPEVPARWPADAGENASFCDTRKAGEELGFRARHLWRHELERAGTSA